jgi:outer membrane protein assembly factor BamB
VKSGDRQWRSSGPTSINSPAVGGGTVYVVRGDGTLLALNGQTGSEEWRSRPGLAGGSSSWAFSSPAVGGGEVCVSSDDGWLHAVDADTGRTAWRFSTGAGVLTSPVISNGVVYVGSDDGYLYAVKE